MTESVSEGLAHTSAHATLHLTDPEAAATELRRAVEELGMRSAMLPVAQPVGRLSDPGFDALWATATDLDVPVVLHPPTKAPSNDLMAQFPALRGLFGRQIDTTLTTAELITTGVFDRFPDLRLVLVHGGGFLPFQAARFDRDAKGDGSERKLPSEVVRSLYYDSVLLSAAAVRFRVRLRRRGKGSRRFRLRRGTEGTGRCEDHRGSDRGQRRRRHDRSGTGRQRPVAVWCALTRRGGKRCHVAWLSASPDQARPTWRSRC